MPILRNLSEADSENQPLALQAEYADVGAQLYWYIDGEYTGASSAQEIIFCTVHFWVSLNLTKVGKLLRSQNELMDFELSSFFGATCHHF